MKAALCLMTASASSYSTLHQRRQTQAVHLRTTFRKAEVTEQESLIRSGTRGVDSSSVLIHPVTNRLLNVKKSQFPRAQSQFFQFDCPKPPNDKNIWGTLASVVAGKLNSSPNLLHSLLIYCHFNELISSELSSRYTFLDILGTRTDLLLTVYKFCDLKIEIVLLIYSFSMVTSPI